nr:ribonuclease H-like domain-containing protein [Tanacetum cinerariifolium]
MLIHSAALCSENNIYNVRFERIWQKFGDFDWKCAMWRTKSDDDNIVNGSPHTRRSFCTYGNSNLESSEFKSLIVISNENNDAIPNVLYLMYLATNQQAATPSFSHLSTRHKKKTSTQHPPSPPTLWLPPIDHHQDSCFLVDNLMKLDNCKVRKESHIGVEAGSTKDQVNPKLAPMSVHGYTDDEFEPDPNITLISKINVTNPLHLHHNDSTAWTVVSIKLKGNENYQVWSCAKLLALEGKNKNDFIDDSCRRSNTDEVLGRQWDRVNAVVLGWILNSMTEEFFLGQIFSKRGKHVWEELKETYD